MKIIRNRPSKPELGASALHQELPPPPPWVVLLVDDEPDVLSVTRLALKNFSYEGRSLHFLEARSAAEARELLATETEEVALALIDVVMESDNAGLELVNHIRNELNNSNTRVIIRTGQPGAAPEREVVDRYDIDDYKDKTELTTTKLYTTVRTALKSYHELVIINDNKSGLEKILEASPDLYRPSSLHSFFEGILTQVIALCNLGKHSYIATVKDGAIVTSTNNEVIIQSAQGRFSEQAPEYSVILQQCTEALLNGTSPEGLPDNIEYISLELGDERFGYICLEHQGNLSETDHHLVQIMVNQCTSALQNINLYQDLNAANRQAVRMLAIAAEFRDKETGDHINRIQQGTYQVALKLGLPEEIAEEYGVASILHDIGKVALPDSILLKPGALTPQEFEIIKQHTTFGVNILNNSDWFELAQEIALSHHERWDGSGYPRGIQGEEIHLAARIVAVVDAFDALGHQRGYKSAWGKRDALSELQSNSGTHFDPRAVNTFIELIESEALYAALPW